MTDNISGETTTPAPTPTAGGRALGGRGRRGAAAKPRRWDPASAALLQESTARLVDDETATTTTDPDDSAPSAGDYAAAVGDLARDAAQAPTVDDAPPVDGDEVGRPEWPDAFAPPAEDQDGSKPRGRDERHRERLRETEAERDRLAGLVETMRAAEIQRLATGLADPRDLFRDGATVADMLDDDGQVDPAKVSGAVDKVLAAHPHWRKPVTPYSGPLRSGATSAPVEIRKSFADAFAPNPEGPR